MRPSFEVSALESRLIHKIAVRAERLADTLGVSYGAMEASMDLTACHANGCPLDLSSLLSADDGNFGHDVFGIRRHINRRSGALGDCFLPRFALPTGDALIDELCKDDR